MAFEVDEVIAATGFVTPLRDLPDLGVATFGQSRLPAQTPFWESATVPGIFFAGTIGQGSKGLMKHGIPANSGAVQGARYNARVLARHIAETPFRAASSSGPPSGPRTSPRSWPASSPADPEIWHQRAYLARILRFEPGAGIVDEGIRPLAWFVDASRAGRARGQPRDRRLGRRSTRSSTAGSTGSSKSTASTADPLLDYETEAARAEVEAVLGRFGAGVR